MGPGARTSSAAAAVNAVIAAVLTGAEDSKGAHITRFGTFVYRPSKRTSKQQKALRFAPSAHFTDLFNNSH